MGYRLYTERVKAREQADALLRVVERSAHHADMMSDANSQQQAAVIDALSDLVAAARAVFDYAQRVEDALAEDRE